VKASETILKRSGNARLRITADSSFSRKGAANDDERMNDMPDAKELLHSNLHEVFSERDPERRRAAIERTYTEDVTFIDPAGAFLGRRALSDQAQKLLDGVLAGFVFEEDGPATLGSTPPRWHGVSGRPVTRSPAGSISSRSVLAA
jgi:hypothetical protein